MMNVGLVTDSSSMPRPIATPRASTVFPAPSSPQRAMTSPAWACAASRSPSRSVWSDEWLTRSIAPESGCARVLRFELAAFTNESNAKADERAEDRGPHRHVPRPGDAKERHAGIARERAGERHEAEEPRHRAVPLEPNLATAPLSKLALLARLGPLGAAGRRPPAPTLSAARHTEARSGSARPRPSWRDPRSTCRSRSA